MALHNLHVLLLKKKGVVPGRSDASGDGTGYSLTISKHYESVSQELKEKAKEQEPPSSSSPSSPQPSSSSSSSSPPPAKDESSTKRAFAYSFRLMDLKTKMHLACGSSLKSEREAFDRAMEMLSRVGGVELDSVRLDRYYSTPGYVDSLGGRETRVFVIPRRNSTLNGSWKWKETMIDFVKNTMKHLEQYYRRENSESGFAADKKMLGWSIAQRREDRIDCANLCKGLWHNLFNLSAF